MMQSGLEGGFSDRPRQSAVAFRAALDVLARPGQVRGVTGVEPPGGLSVAAAALLLTLADAETPLWLPERLRVGAVAEWLRFHTNAPQAAGRGQAMFAVGRWEELLPLEDWPAGEPAYPDRAATLIVEVAALDGGPVLALSGPGIDGHARLAPMLPEGAAEALRVNAARFPLGLDFFFTAGRQVAGLPRSTRIGPWIGG
ncbi:MAG: phosphonate C-P lyase system protein PhnH [Thermohalobaculum sp.]